jgi:hypothetical protein
MCETLTMYDEDLKYFFFFLLLFSYHFLFYFYFIFILFFIIYYLLFIKELFKSIKLFTHNAPYSTKQNILVVELFLIILYFLKVLFIINLNFGKIDISEIRHSFFIIFGFIFFKIYGKKKYFWRIKNYF